MGTSLMKNLKEKVKKYHKLVTIWGLFVAFCCFPGCKSCFSFIRVQNLLVGPLLSLQGCAAKAPFRLLKIERAQVTK